ncbi:glycerophosphodiester phosphodiesterase family protein [Alteriqipengyuania lutimaris]|uniref:Glycerophosphodiester phosphodiesterase n=1 Tax=Alteriqipengyuania lutimaris TaxID=1538146 RepID=A0A395LJX6_9SPHN|nr:glycerophosphodiester phosphodiesterase family protein [Alteriqipengyuania lutimaris]MBB3035150.1 glycerophosphoryl diester phosphodiesterase [Alteriqipengyuania lutimaris]RDS75764.1 glycerophosphodiester phosphodiesterase [Alteriqipengyuania lutimaris]
MKAFLLPSLIAASLTAVPAVSQETPRAWSLDTGGDLSAFLDCMEARQRTIVSAHRGGPTPGLPENSIEAMDALLHAAPAIMEIDVAQSSDGVLFLLHDDRLDRTTTGRGTAAQQQWADLAKLRLRDEAGWTTPYGIPTLAQALAWAKGRTVLQIDFKPSASYDNTIAAIRDADMQHSVVLIAYSVASAVRLHRLAPDMTISLSINRFDALAEAIEAGIPSDRIVAFTGTRLPQPDLYAALDESDVEVIFGTLGGAQSIDRQIGDLGIDERYADLGAAGVDIIATDRPREAAEALAEAGRLAGEGICGASRR